MYKLAVIGDRTSVLGFRSLGLEVYTPNTPDQTRNVIDRLAKEGTAVIYITERLAAGVPETIERYASSLMPAIIPIPDSQGSLGLGQQGIRSRVEKAVGYDILK